jgi:hypothetical protein
MVAARQVCTPGSCLAGRVDHDRGSLWESRERLVSSIEVTDHRGVGQFRGLRFAGLNGARIAATAWRRQHNDVGEDCRGPETAGWSTLPP